MRDFAIGLSSGAELSIEANVTGSTHRAFSTVHKKLEELDKRAGKISLIQGKSENTLALHRELKTLTTAASRTANASDELKGRIRNVRGAYAEVRRNLRSYGLSLRDASTHSRMFSRALEAHQKVKNSYKISESNQQKREEITGKAFKTADPVISAGLIIKRAIEFEDQFADVEKVFDAPKSALSALEQDILRMSTKIPIKVTGLTDIAVVAGKAGIAREELSKFVADAAKVSLSFDISESEGGSALSGMRTLLGLNQDEVMVLTGAMNHLSNNMDASAKNILNITTRTAAAADQFGLTGAQLSALNATFLASKTPPKMASTAINTMLRQLSMIDRGSEAAKNALSDMGTSAEELKEAIGSDAQGALLDFLERVKDSDNVTSTLVDLFGKESADEIGKLVKTLDTYKESIKLVSNEKAYANSVYEDYEKRAATTKNQLVMLENQGTRLAINLGQVFLPTIGSAASGLSEVSEVVYKTTQAHPGLTRAVLLGAGGLLAFRVASLATRYSITLVSDAVQFGVRAFHLMRPSVITANIVLLRHKAIQAASMIQQKAHAAAVMLNSGRIATQTAIQRVWTVVSTRAGKQAMLSGIQQKAHAAAVMLNSGRIATQTAIQRVWTVVSTRAGRLAMLSGIQQKAHAVVTGLNTGRIAAQIVIQKAWAVASSLSGTALKKVIVVSRALGLAMAANPIGAAIAGISIGAALVIANWETVRAYFGTAWKYLARVFGIGLKVVQSVFSWSPLGLIIQNWEPITRVFRTVAASIKLPFESVFGWIKGKIDWALGVGQKIAGLVGLDFGNIDASEVKLTPPGLAKIPALGIADDPRRGQVDTGKVSNEENNTINRAQNLVYREDHQEGKRFNEARTLDQTTVNNTIESIHRSTEAIDRITRTVSNEESNTTNTAQNLVYREDHQEGKRFNETRTLDQTTVNNTIENTHRSTEAIDRITRTVSNEENNTINRAQNLVYREDHQEDKRFNETRTLDQTTVNNTIKNIHRSTEAIDRITRTVSNEESNTINTAQNLVYREDHQEDRRFNQTRTLDQATVNNTIKNIHRSTEAIDRITRTVSNEESNTTNTVQNLVYREDHQEGKQFSEVRTRDQTTIHNTVKNIHLNAKGVEAITGLVAIQTKDEKEGSKAGNVKNVSSLPPAHTPFAQHTFFTQKPVESPASFDISVEFTGDIVVQGSEKGVDPVDLKRQINNAVKQVLPQAMRQLQKKGHDLSMEDVV